MKESINQDVRNALRELLLPFARTVHEREALVSGLWVGARALRGSLRLEGQPLEFVNHLIETLLEFGTINDQHGVWLLLEDLKYRVGDEKHLTILELQSYFATPKREPRRVFISYSRQNSAFTRVLENDLKNAGMEVWIDYRKLQGGDRWREEIERAIQYADYVVVCLSSAAITSFEVRQELKHALTYDKFVIPLLLEQVVSDLSLPENEPISWLLQRNMISFMDDATFGSALMQLLAAFPNYRLPNTYFPIDPDDIRNPFVGLNAFTEANADLFFGRENEIQHLLVRLTDDAKQPLLAVVGSSGSGKSSLVHAGLLPKLDQQDDDFPFRRRWAKVFKPGQHPVRGLAQAIATLLPDESVDAIVERFRQDEHALHDLVQSCLQGMPNRRLLLVIDQFEEFFAQSVPDETTLVFKQLYHAVTAQDAQLYVLLTMRADFFDRLGKHQDLAALINDNLFFVAEMSRVALRRSIQDSAMRVGLVYEDGLVEQIIDDVEDQPGSLPLLQYALTLLFDERMGRRLTQSGYDAIGGVQGSLARHANQIYESFSLPQQAVMRFLILRLIEFSGDKITRRRALRETVELSAYNPQIVDGVVERLTQGDARLLVASVVSPDDPRVTLEISHEALINHWPRLANWIQENRAALLLEQELRTRTLEWERRKFDSSYLFPANRLGEVEQWGLNDALSEQQREYIRASFAYHRRRRWLRNAVTVVIALLALAAVVAALFAFDGQARAVAARDSANTQTQIARSGTVALQGLLELENSRFDRALLLSLAALDIYDTREARSMLLSTLQQIPQLRQLTQVHSAAVRGIAFSPDASRALSADAAGQLHVWAFASGRLEDLQMIATDSPIWDVAYSPDGQQFVTAHGDGTVRVWNAENPAPTGQVLGEAGSSTAYSVSFSSDGTLLAVGYGDRQDDTNNVVRLWNMESGGLHDTLTGYTDYVYSVAFSSDGQLLATGAGDGIRLWALNGDQTILRHFMDEHRNWVLDVAFSLDDRYLISGSADNTVRFWDVASGDPVGQPFTDHTGWVQEVAFSPGGTSAVTSGLDRTLVIRDAVLGRRLESSPLLVGHNEGVASLAFSHDGRWILTGGNDGQIILWSTQPEQPLSQVLDVNTMDAVRSLVFTPEGDQLIGAAADGTVVAWNYENDSTPQTVLSLSSELTALALSHNGQHLALGTASGDVQLYDYANRSLLHTVRAHDNAVSSLEFSLDDSVLATGSYDRQVKTWRIDSGFELQSVMLAHEDWVTAIALFPDNPRLISGGFDGRIIEWNYQTGALIRELPQTHTDAITAVRLSHDGRFLATSSRDGTIMLWDTATAQPIGAPIVAHDDGVVSLLISPDDTMLVSAGNDGRIAYWDVSTQQPIGQPFGTFNWRTNGLAIHPAGLFIATTSESPAAVRLWDIDLASWRARACQIVDRPFTDAEIRQFAIDATAAHVCSE